MSNVSTRVTREEPGIDRLQRWIASIFSALLHVLLLFVLLYASKPDMTAPQSAASGSRVRVNFIGEPRESEQPVQTPQVPSSSQSQASAPTSPATSRLRSTLVDHADNPVPPESSARSDTRNARRSAGVHPRPDAPSQRSSRDASSRSQTPPSNNTPPSAPRRPEMWTGQPPGLLADDAAPTNAGLADRPAIHDGRGRDVAASGPSMELGGYLVYYDVLSEDKLRGWRDQGIKELYIPLPGTQYYMICTLEMALRRESGRCRALDPHSPEMQKIGDARQVVTMLQVYKRGELVWRGPGPYK